LNGAWVTVLNLAGGTLTGPLILAADPTTSLGAATFFRGSVMMGRAPRVPVDLQAVTRATKARVRRVIGNLEAIEQQQDPIFASLRDVFLELVLSIHELEAAAAKMRKAWWPPP
jgi:hypothetical protein